jgi:hypothetical protein
MRSEQRGCPTGSPLCSNEDEDWRQRDERRVELLVTFLCLVGRACSRRDLTCALWQPEDSGDFDRPLKLAMARGLVARVKRGYYAHTDKAHPVALASAPRVRISLVPVRPFSPRHSDMPGGPVG